MFLCFCYKEDPDLSTYAYLLTNTYFEDKFQICMVIDFSDNICFCCFTCNNRQQKK